MPTKRRVLKISSKSALPAADPMVKVFSPTHTVSAWFEREMQNQEGEPESSDSAEPPTAAVLYGSVKIDGQSRTLCVQRGYRRHGVVGKFAEEVSLMLDTENWDGFVALINQLDAEVDRVVKRCG